MSREGDLYLWGRALDQEPPGCQLSVFAERFLWRATGYFQGCDRRTPPLENVLNYWDFLPIGPVLKLQEDSIIKEYN